MTWKNTSQTVHNVVDDPTKAMTASDVQRQSYVHVFSEPGVYGYVCTLHEGSGVKARWS